MFFVLEQELADDNGGILPGDIVKIQDIPEFGIGFAKLPQNRMGRIKAPHKPHYFVVLPKIVQREIRNNFSNVSVGTKSPNPRIEPPDCTDFIGIDPEVDVSSNALKQETYFLTWKLTSIEPGTDVVFKGYITNPDKRKKIMEAIKKHIDSGQILWSTLYSDNRFTESLENIQDIIVVCEED